MIIGFDLDDVLLSFQDTMRQYHNETYGTNYTREQDNTWNLWERWNCTPEESVKRVRDFFAHESHHAAPPLPGSVDAIRALKQNHEFCIITAKPESFKEKTEEWLEKHFPNMFDKLVFTNAFHGDGKKRKKSEVCNELGVQIYIEDAMHNAQDVADNGIPVFLMDSPWNQGELPSPLITRVFSWDEIVEKINK